MIEYEGKNFELKFNISRVELIEQQTELPTLVQMHKTRGNHGETAERT